MPNRLGFHAPNLKTVTFALVQEKAWGFASEELLNYTFYQWLSQKVSNQSLRQLLLDFALEEKKHFNFWANYTAEKPRYNQFKLWLYKILAKVLGITFILRLLEQNEHKTIAVYRALADEMRGSEREALLELIVSEERHEHTFLQELSEHEPRLNYIGFVVLGLSDAIIEVTGVHAGFLGASHRTLAAGVAGLIVGFAASISMAAAAYLQAKQNPVVSSIRSAFYTGISYILAVVLLALPYFLVLSVGLAFWLSIALAIGLIGSFVFYSSVVFERNFWGEFLESLLVLGGTALASYGFGELIRWLFPQAFLLG